MGFMDSLKQQASSVQLQYLGGHPEASTAGNVTVVRDGDYIVFSGVHRPPNIFVSNVKKVELDKASKRSAGKAAAGAIIGGVLTGGIGLIAGAAIGGRKKDDSIIVMTVAYKGMDVEMVFGGDDVSKKYGKFTALLAAPVSAKGASVEEGGEGEVSVILTAFGDNKKISVMTVLQKLNGLGLKDAKDMVDSLPHPVKERVTRAEADALRVKLEAAGATVEIR